MRGSEYTVSSSGDVSLARHRPVSVIRSHKLSNCDNRESLINDRNDQLMQRLIEDAKLLVLGIQGRFEGHRSLRIFHVTRASTEIGKAPGDAKIQTPIASRWGTGASVIDEGSEVSEILQPGPLEVTPHHISPPMAATGKAHRMRPVLIFEGLSSKLSISDFSATLKEFGTMYEFLAEVTGGPADDDGYKSQCSGIAEGRGDMTRAGVRFCWITAPKAPVLDELLHSSCIFRWDCIRYHTYVEDGVDIRNKSRGRAGTVRLTSRNTKICSRDGVYIRTPAATATPASNTTTTDATAEGVFYSLEIAAGPERQRPGVAKRFVTDLTFSEPVEVCRSQSEFQFKCYNLCSSRTYRVRLVVEYGGVRFPSVFMDFTTPPAPPPPPSMPRLTKKTFASDTPGSIAINIKWRDIALVMPPVTHYECYRRQTFRRVDTSLAASPTQKHTIACHKVRESSDSQQTTSPIDYLDETGEWELICEGPLNSTRLWSPVFGCVGWEIRVRAQSAHGWSEFSPSLTLSWKNQSALFPAGFFRPIGPGSCGSTDTDIGSNASLYSSARCEPGDQTPSREDHGFASDNTTAENNCTYRNDEDYTYDDEDFEGIIAQPGHEANEEDLDEAAEVCVREKPILVPHSPRIIRGDAQDKEDSPVQMGGSEYAVLGDASARKSPRVLATATD